MWVFITIAIALIFIIPLIIVTSHYRRDRAKLTLEQRKEEDQALKSEGIIY